MVYIKSESEIELMRESGRIVKETLDFVGKNIHAGMTTKEVDELVYRYITSCGATPSSLGYGGFPASACVSVNEVVVHGIPSDRVIADGDIVSVDITAEAMCPKRSVGLSRSPKNVSLRRLRDCKRACLSTI